MAKSLREVMIGKTDAALMDYLNNFSRYTPEALTAATEELKRRGRAFSDEELDDIKVKIQTTIKAEREEETLWPSDSWKQSVVTDPNAPLLYSKGAISGFSILFNTVFGAVLLACNVSDPKKKCIVVGFGALYTAITMSMVSFIPSNAFWIFLINTGGGLGLTTTFWDKYVGKEVRYRAKPVWKPLMISVIIVVPFLIALIYE